MRFIGITTLEIVEVHAVLNIYFLFISNFDS